MTRSVLLVSRIFAPERAAAAYRLSALYEALESAGASLHVLTSRSPHDETSALVGTSERGRVSRWPVLRDADGYLRGYLPYVSFDLPLVLRLALVRRPDVVVVEPPPTTGAVVRTVLAVRRAASRRPIPYVYYAADVWSDASASTGAPHWVVSVLRWVERYALSGAVEVIAVTEGVADRVRILGARTVTVVPNGIDTHAFSPDHPGDGRGVQGAWRDLDIPAGPFLLYAGTASEWQGAEIFAAAMRLVVEEIPEARVVFLGQGTSWPTVQRIAETLPAGAITCLPLAMPAEAAVWHRAACAALVSVKPDIGYDFAYPTKVLAALACGTPVIYVGPGPAAADLREHGLGVAVSYEVEAVAEAMLVALRLKPDGPARRARVDWVHAHRSVEATAKAAAEVILRPHASPRRARV
ncbi:MAG: glycosyltransferase [Ornithinimicrobium sp.]